MSATFFFPPGGDDELGTVSGSSFGEPDGTNHSLELLEGNGNFIIRFGIENNKPVDLLLTRDQAINFTKGAIGILRRLGFDKQE